MKTDEIIDRLRSQGDDPVARGAAVARLSELQEANMALTSSLFAAWNALNEIHHDAAEMEADVFKTLEAYGNKPIDAERWPCDHPAHKS